jgi:hypothetical protein
LNLSAIFFCSFLVGADAKVCQQALAFVLR